MGQGEKVKQGGHDTKRTRSTHERPHGGGRTLRGDEEERWLRAPGRLRHPRARAPNKEPTTPRAHATAAKLQAAWGHASSQPRVTPPPRTILLSPIRSPDCPFVNPGRIATLPGRHASTFLLLGLRYGLGSRPVACSSAGLQHVVLSLATPPESQALSVAARVFYRVCGYALCITMPSTINNAKLCAMSIRPNIGCSRGRDPRLDASSTQIILQIREYMFLPAGSSAVQHRHTNPCFIVCCRSLMQLGHFLHECPPSGTPDRTFE